MSGVSLPAIPGALPAHYKASYTGLERPDSRSSIGTASSYTGFLSNNASYGKFVLSLNVLFIV